MVLFTVTLVAAQGKGSSLASALRPLALQAQNDHGCFSSRLAIDLSNSNVLHYIQEWATERDLWSHIKSERFERLIALMETAAEQPLVSVRLVSCSYGLEYIHDVLKSGRP